VFSSVNLNFLCSFLLFILFSGISKVEVEIETVVAKE